MSSSWSRILDGTVSLTRHCTYRYIILCTFYFLSYHSIQYYYLRAVGRKVLWSSACVCLSVCAHCFCPQDISRTGSWITTKFGGWEQGVNL